MTMKLIGHLQSTYKSFDTDFRFEFEGSLVIVSGINGGGKTQLFEIIRQLKPPNRQPDIPVTIQLDSVNISRDEVGHR